MIFRKRQEQLDDAYDDGVATGMQIGYLTAETRIKNYIAQIGELDWLLDELDNMDAQDD